MLILFLFFALIRPNLANSNSCYLPFFNNQDLFMQCISGQVLAKIPKTSFSFQKDTASERSVLISTFLVSLEPVRLTDYLRFLELSHKKVSTNLDTLISEHKKEELLKGLTFKEALEYCKFFGMDLPTEAELELLYYQKGLINKTDFSELSKDFYKEIVPIYYEGLDPKQNAPSFKYVMRKLNSLNRFSINPHLSYADLVFRCTKRNYSLNTDLNPVIQIDSSPRGAKVYADKNANLLLGQTPVIRSVKTSTIFLEYALAGYQPEIITSQIKKGFAYNFIAKLRPTLNSLAYDYKRDVSQVKVSEGFVKVDNLYARKAFIRAFLIDKELVSYRQYLNYIEDNNLAAPRCKRHLTKDLENTPITCVDFLEAYNFCNSYGLSLPSYLDMQKVKQDKISLAGFTYKEWLIDYQDIDFNKNLRTLTKYQEPVAKTKKLIFPEGSLEPNKYRLDLGFRCIKPESLSN